MYKICALVLMAQPLMAPPFIQDANFPRTKQEAVLNATLRLKNPDTNGEGTAIRIGRRGPRVCYLTANHNVKDAKNGVNLEAHSTAKFPNVVKIPLADILQQWPQIDLALLTAVEPDPPGFLPVLKDHQPKATPFPALSCGCSGGNLPEFIADQVEARIRGKHKGGIESLLWRTTKPPEEGRSGGAIIDTTGYLIGICSGKDNGKGYYISLDEIVKALDQNHKFLLETTAKTAKSE